MFIPIGDENPRETTPYVNYGLLGLNIAAFVFLCFPRPHDWVLQEWALIPISTHWSDLPSLKTLVTSMFLHANLLHLAGNMLFLWIFGDNVEDRLGHVPYLIFYLLCGLGAGALHVTATNTPQIPTLGASGAISGVIGAYVLFFPKHRVKMLIWIYFWIQILLIPAWIWIGIWFLEQLVMAAYLANREVGGVAYGAHIGGFLAGAGLAGVTSLLTRVRRGVQRTSSGLPTSRAPSRTRAYFQPLVRVEDVPEIAYVDEPHTRYAVLRLNHELHHAGSIALAAAGVTGEPVAAVSHRLDATRGLLASDLTRPQAEKVQIALRPQGIPTFLVPWGPAFAPPAPLTADRLTWDDRLLSLTQGGQMQSFYWNTPFLHIAAVLDHEPFIDLYVTRKSAFRVASHTGLKEVNPYERRERHATLRDLAQAILRHAPGAVTNEGISVLARGGSWGWLNFRRLEDFNDYSFWMYHLILSRRNSR